MMKNIKNILTNFTPIKWIQLGVYLVLCLVVVYVIWSIFSYLNEIDTLKSNNALLEQSVIKQQNTIDALNEDFGKIRELQQETEQSRQETIKKIRKNERNFKEIINRSVTPSNIQETKQLEFDVNKILKNKRECFKRISGNEQSDCDLLDSSDINSLR